MSLPGYIKRIEDSPLYQYEKTMAINRCMADYSHMDDASRGKFCLDKLGYYIVTQPHKTRAMRLEEGTGGALNVENYSPLENTPKDMYMTLFVVVMIAIIAYLLLKK